jgi:hypothetical protein
MRLISVLLLLLLVAAGCGWKPSSGTQATPDNCTPAEGPTADTVNYEIAQLPALPGGEQWREVARGHTTNCRLYWVQVGSPSTAPDSPQQVLLFDRNSPIGTPTREPRPYIAVSAGPGADTVTVHYQWRQAGEQPCCPTGVGQVRFQVDSDGKLRALDAIPNP